MTGIHNKDKTAASQGEGALTLEDLRGNELGFPVTLPPFDPVKDVPEAPDYTTTVMNVAVPTIVHDLDTNVTAAQSAIALYALVMSMFMITGRKMGDICGRNTSFRRGLIIYGIGKDSLRRHHKY